MTRNYSDPPKGESFRSLLDHIFQHGIGNEVSPSGLPQPWTPDTLEAHADHLGHELSARALDNWRSGRARPQVRKLHVLARVVSEDAVQARRWAHALIDARNRSQGADGAAGAGSDEDSGAPEASEASRLQRVLDAAARQPVRVIAGYTVAVFLLGVAAAELVDVATRSHETHVRDFRICSVANFDDVSKTCLADERHFETGVEQLRVSFTLPKTEPAQQFTRSWYYNSMLFHRFTSYNDSVWPGWTYFNNANGWPNGDYALRIEVEGRVHTYRFKVGSTRQIGEMDRYMKDLQDAL